MKVQRRLDGKSGRLLYSESYTGAPTGVKPRDAGVRAARIGGSAEAVWIALDRTGDSNNW